MSTYFMYTTTENMRNIGVYIYMRNIGIYKYEYKYKNMSIQPP